MTVQNYITPRGLSRAQAASYVGLGTTFFDQKVADGTFPKSFKIGSRTLWDIRKLDVAFDSLDDSVPTLESNPWDA